MTFQKNVNIEMENNMKQTPNKKKIKLEENQIESNATTPNRSDTSLSSMTKKFLKLLLSQKNYEIDLNDAEKILNLKKRRLYDISNCLEGVGAIKKIGKNKIKWVVKGENLENPKKLENPENLKKPENELKNNKSELKKTNSLSQLSTSELLQKIKILENEESQLDQMISQQENELNILTSNENDKKLAYITCTDLKNCSFLENKIVLCIKTDQGTVIDINNCEKSSKIDLKLKSEKAIKIFLVKNGNEGRDKTVKEAEHSANLPKNSLNNELNSRISELKNDLNNELKNEINSESQTIIQQTQINYDNLSDNNLSNHSAASSNFPPPIYSQKCATQKATISDDSCESSPTGNLPKEFSRKHSKKSILANRNLFGGKSSKNTGDSIALPQNQKPLPETLMQEYFLSLVKKEKESFTDLFQEFD